MHQEVFSLKKINESLLQGVEKQDVNFATLLTAALEDKLSVIAKYEPAPFYTLDSDGKIEVADSSLPCYYGLSPKIDSEIIIECISRLQFSNLTKLDNFIKKHSNLFMCHSRQKQYLFDFARYALLAYASNYALKIELTPELQRICSEVDAEQHFLKLQDDFLFICGCPTDELLEALADLRFLVKNDAMKVCTQSAAKAKTIYDLYADPVNIRLYNGHVLYSGVLLKPLKFEKLKNCYENYKVDTIQICFERSTYATVFALDGNYLWHPVLPSQTRRNISKMLREDDKCKTALMQKLSNNNEINNKDYTCNAISDLNEYLADCVNVNQIGVSANIVTQDDIVLFGERNKNTIDSGNLYPGVNGNAEVADKDVSFYRYSVYEDYPTIRLDDDRIDFAGEIGRETYAELECDVNNQEWNCIGVLLSGSKPPETELENAEYSTLYRRMHFNILFEQKSSANFKQICSDSVNAAETFENANIFGFNMRCYTGFGDYAAKGLKWIVETLIRSKDTIESILLIALTMVGVGITGPDLFSFWEIKKHWISSNAMEKLSIFFAFIFLILAVIHFIGFCRNQIFKRKSVRRLTFFKKNSYILLEKKIRKITAKYKYHPAAYACLQLAVIHCIQLSSEPHRK